MPELPEVEIVRRSLDKKIKNRKVKKVIVRNRNLRFKVPKGFENFLKNQKFRAKLGRRSVDPISPICPFGGHSKLSNDSPSWTVHCLLCVVSLLFNPLTGF